MSLTTNAKTPSRVWQESVEMPVWVDAKVLAAGVSETYTTPTNANWALISGDGGFYIKRGSSAAVPAADDITGASAFYVPAGIQLRIPGGVQHAVISSANRVITIACYP